MKVNICEDVAQALGELETDLNRTIRTQKNFIMGLENWYPKKKRNMNAKVKNLIYQEGILEGLKFASAILNHTKDNWSTDINEDFNGI